MNAPAVDLFTYADRYPQAAGFKRAGTSSDAGASIDAGTLRAKVLETLAAHGPLTADEAAGKLGLSILSIRPRCTELQRLGRIADSGDRRENASRRRAIVWMLLA